MGKEGKENRGGEGGEGDGARRMFGEEFEVESGWIDRKENVRREKKMEKGVD